MLLDIFVDGVGDLDGYHHITDADVRREATRAINEMC